MKKTISTGIKFLWNTHFLVQPALGTTTLSFPSSRQFFPRYSILRFYSVSTVKSSNQQPRWNSALLSRFSISTIQPFHFHFHLFPRQRPQQSPFRSHSRPRFLTTPSSPSSIAPSIPKKVTSTPPPSFPPSKPGLYNRLKHGMKSYGRPAFYTYMIISGIDLTLSFVAVYMGVDVDKVVGKIKVWGRRVGEMVGVTGWGGSATGSDSGVNREEKENVDMVEMDKVETGEEKEEVEKEGKKKSLMTTFLIAYAFHKLLVPIRIPLTLALTPTVVRWLRTWGWLKDAGAISGMVTMAGGSKEVVRQAAKGKVVGGDMKKVV